MSINICDMFIKECDVKPECIEQSGTDALFVAMDTTKKAAKNKFIIQNNSRKYICKVKIDGCVIADKTNNGKKTDYLLINNNDKIIYIVECKGRHIEYAIEQILSMIERYKDKEFFRQALKVNAYAVCTRVPDISDKQKLKIKKTMTALNGTFIYKSKVLEVSA